MGQSESEAFLRKAEESLSAASSLRSKKKNNSAANRACYAVLQAQLATLIKFKRISKTKEGEYRRGGIAPSFFSNFIRHKKTFREGIIAETAELESLREMADYQPQDVSDREADRAVRIAGRIVADIKAKLLEKKS